MVFIMLSGVLSTLNFLDVDSTCLHSVNDKYFPPEVVDIYQYSLTALLWIVSIPMIVMIFMVGMRDNLKFSCYPIIIVNIIFSFMIFVLSQIVVIASIIYSNSTLL